MFASIKSCEKSALFEGMSFQSKLRLGAQSSYVVKYFEGSNAVKTTSIRNLGALGALGAWASDKKFG